MYLRIAISVPKRSNNGMTHRIAASANCKEVRMLFVIVFGDVLSFGPSGLFTMLISFVGSAISLSLLLPRFLLVCVIKWYTREIRE